MFLYINTTEPEQQRLSGSHSRHGPVHTAVTVHYVTETTYKIIQHVAALPQLFSGFIIKRGVDQIQQDSFSK